MCTMRPPNRFDPPEIHGPDHWTTAPEPCDHGRNPETCDDCNEQRGADMAEASVGK